MNLPVETEFLFYMERDIPCMLCKSGLPMSRYKTIIEGKQLEQGDIFACSECYPVAQVMLQIGISPSYWGKWPIDVYEEVYKCLSIHTG